MWMNAGSNIRGDVLPLAKRCRQQLGNGWRFYGPESNTVETFLTIPNKQIKWNFNNNNKKEKERKIENTILKNNNRIDRTGRLLCVDIIVIVIVFLLNISLYFNFNGLLHGFHWNQRFNHSWRKLLPSYDLVELADYSRYVGVIGTKAEEPIQPSIWDSPTISWNFQIIWDYPRRILFEDVRAVIWFSFSLCQDYSEAWNAR